MLRSPDLERLVRRLTAVADRLSGGIGDVGHAELVEVAVRQTEKLFHGYTKAIPSKQTALAAALAFLRGERLTDRQLDMIAGGLCDPVREQSGATVVGHRTFKGLLNTYRKQASDGGLWRLTWYGLVCSYFSFDPSKASAAEKVGWAQLQLFLEETWPLIDRESGGGPVPEWVGALRKDSGLLTHSATDRYASEYLAGDETGVRRVESELGVPEGSWFWHALVLGAVKRSTTLRDEPFKASISRLLQLVTARPAYRDDALELMLDRYHRCKDAGLHPQLRDYVIRKDVWKNPKLRDVGIATAWNRVSEDVWRMVLQWVNEANLRDFFEILAARRNSDEGRLAFWSKYLDQIRWTRLIFSVQTKALASSNPSIRSLIAREEGAYATISTNTDVDGFMMQVGNYLIVEFSQTPNAAYIYKVNELPFQPYAPTYTGTTQDLKSGFRGEKAGRIIHKPGWEFGADIDLRALGIRPDTPTVKAGPTGTFRRAQPTEAVDDDLDDAAPPGAPFTMKRLEQLVAKYSGAWVRDERSKGTASAAGRLWVEDPNQNARLAQQLKEFGFRWANARSAHYYPPS